MANKIALITGITGQDSSYLAELLLDKDYEVHGVMRRSSIITSERIDHIFNPEGRCHIHYGDLTEGLDNIISEVKPDLIFNMGAMSHVWISFKQPVYTAETNAIGVLKLLESVKRAQKLLGKQIRVYQASSSEMWGSTPPIQNENSSMQPQSPYGVSKLFGYHIIKVYRKSYEMFASNGILHNHSSPRRGHNFATRKITRTAARISLGLLNNIELGNLEAIRDEGHSKDYMDCVVKILEHEKPDDFVVAMGEGHTIREWAEKSFKYFNLDFYKYLKNNDSLKRPSEVDALIGDSTKARTILKWEPQYTYESLIEEMCKYDYEQALLEIKNPHTKYKKGL
jgi:GDPmannose 4,6-dehydratase